MRVFPFIVKDTVFLFIYPASFFLLLFYIFLLPADAANRILLSDHSKDTSRYVVVHAISIEGLKQTKRPIVLRELPFRENDTIERKSFPDMIRSGKENIFNTALFNIVTIDTILFAGTPEQADVTIHVIERWYIWPRPFFEISDRNFNSWVETTDLSRLTYGIDLSILNVRGRNETLRFPIHYGFNQKIGFGYRIPYLDRRKTLGVAFGAEYNRNHEVIAETRNNKTVYYKDPVHFPRQNLYAYAEITARTTFYTRHTFRIGFNDWYFSDSLLNISGYAADSSHFLTYFSLYYQYKNDHRDAKFYPLTGSYFDVELNQNGLWSSAVNEFFLKTNFRKYLQIHDRWYFATGITAKITLTPQPPYFLQRGLGYNRDFIRGYEYYVVDGKDFLLWKNNFKFVLVPQRIFHLGFLTSRKFNTVPFALYINLSGDAGYVYNSNTHDNAENDLRNTLLLGYGAGFDFTTYYDLVIRLEVSVNGKGEPGLYLHFMAPI
jgi:outer membrane protein assembly factor BamA